jgi:signal transduction histidine kinase
MSVPLVRGTDLTGIYCRTVPRRARPKKTPGKRTRTIATRRPAAPAAPGKDERLLAVMEIARAVASTLDLDDILRRVLHHVTVMLGCDRATLFLIDDEKRELWSRVALGAGAGEIRLSMDRGIAGHTARTGEAVCVADAPSDPRFDAEVDARTGYSTRSVLSVPMRDKAGAIIGVIEALNHQGDGFTAEDQALLQVVGAQTVIAMETARLYQWMVDRNRQLAEAQQALRTALLELDVLYALEKEVSAAQNFQQLLDALIAKAMALVQVEAGSVLLVEEQTGQLFFKSAIGAKGEEVKRLRLHTGQGLAGWVAQTGRPIRTNDAQRHPAFDATVAEKVGFETRSALCVPIVADRGCIGALELLNKTAGRLFDEDDERIATLIAGQAARAITIGRQREEGERQARLAALGQMISGLLHDLRTPLTIVSGYAQLLATEEAAGRGEAVEIILKQVDHVEAMVRETLSFARGERDILLRRVYLDKFMDEVRMHLSKDFEGRGIEIEIRDNYRGIAKMDETKIRRAIYNIARNAAEAMPEGGRFTLSLDREEDQVVFRFSDTGKGVPEEIAQSIFKSFVTQGKAEGTGLGLAMVKTVADQHKGDVSFVSTAGKGTTFTLRIPA